MATHEQKVDAIRAYWREKKQAQRAAKKKIVFEPHITEFQRCSLCGQWHPTYYILASGHNGRISLDSYHSKETILNFVRAIDARRARALDHYEAFMRRAHVIDISLEMCMDSRMRFYHETENIARANCMIIIEDPLYRHFPEGLTKDPQGRYDLVGDVLVPVEICKDLELSMIKNPTIKRLQVCFTDKMKENPDLDPAAAMQQCMSEIDESYGEGEKPAVGDLFGKTPAEIRRISKRKPDPSFTVGDLFGKTRKQILRMQRLGWDEAEHEAFEACVKQKMEKEGMTREEAEKACEALSVITDAKLESAGDIHGQI